MKLNLLFRYLVYANKDVSESRTTAVYALFQFRENPELQNEDDVREVFNSVKADWSQFQEEFYQRQIALLPEAVELAIREWRELQNQLKNPEGIVATLLAEEAK